MELANQLRTDFIDTTEISTKDNWDEYWKATRHNETIKKVNKGIYLKGFGTFLAIIRGNFISQLLYFLPPQQ